jgi:hypothetical protein
MKLSVYGDVCLTGEPETIALSDENYRLFLQDYEQEPYREIIIANIESAITNGGRPRPLKWATLRAHPSALCSLRGLDVAVLANNHVSDFDPGGSEETLTHLEAVGIAAVGFGPELEDALMPAIVSRPEGKLGIVALSCPTTNGENLATPISAGVAPLGLHTLRKAITLARAQADVVLVYLHWGIEQCHDPVPEQMRIARRAIDWGADAVVGCHAHVIQSFEEYNGRWIFYGLGNYVFGPVETLEVSADGSTQRGRQEQGPANRQSLSVTFRLERTGERTELHLEKIQPFAFGDDYKPMEITFDQLTFDIDQANRRLSDFALLHELELASEEEPMFRSVLRNGQMAYFYTSSPISDIGQPNRVQVGGILRRLKRAYRRNH